MRAKKMRAMDSANKGIAEPGSGAAPTAGVESDIVRPAAAAVGGDVAFGVDIDDAGVIVRVGIGGSYGVSGSGIVGQR